MAGQTPPRELGMSISPTLATASGAHPPSHYCAASGWPRPSHPNHQRGFSGVCPSLSLHSDVEDGSSGRVENDKPVEQQGDNSENGDTHPHPPNHAWQLGSPVCLAPEHCHPRCGPAVTGTAHPIRRTPKSTGRHRHGHHSVQGR